MSILFVDLQKKNVLIALLLAYNNGTGGCSMIGDNIKRLIDKGFLVPIKEGSNIYDFYGELCACQPIIPQKKTTIPFKF